MNQPPTTAGTWAPDWRTLKKARDKAIRKIPYANDDQFNEAAYGAIVSEYQRQAAAAGWIMVPDDYVLDAAMLAGQSLPRQDGPQSDATQELYDEVNYLLEISQRSRRTRLVATQNEGDDV